MCVCAFMCVSMYVYSSFNIKLLYKEFIKLSLNCIRLVQFGELCVVDLTRYWYSSVVQLEGVCSERAGSILSPESCLKYKRGSSHIGNTKVY